MILCTGNRLKYIACKLKGVITSERGIARTKNDLDLIISASNYYCFRTNIQTCILKLWQDKEIFHDMKSFQDMEGLVLNRVEIPIEIEDIEISKDKEISRIWKLNITHSIS